MPKVGIFFFIGDQILIDAVSAAQGERYGDALQHGGHYEFWEKLLPKNIAERSFKSRVYDAYPRGRVVCFPKRKKFCLYHDACLRPEREIREVIEKFQLAGAKIEIMEDGHYKCDGCNRVFCELAHI